MRADLVAGGPLDPDKKSIAWRAGRRSQAFYFNITMMGYLVALGESGNLLHTRVLQAKHLVASFRRIAISKGGILVTAPHDLSRRRLGVTFLSATGPSCLRVSYLLRASKARGLSPAVSSPLRALLSRPGNDER